MDRKRDSEQMATESSDDPQAGTDTTLQSETGKAPERGSWRALSFFRRPRRSLIPFFLFYFCKLKVALEEWKDRRSPQRTKLKSLC